ncbi:MAG: tRNA (guanosine(46)-N7)-methyltransferase TrmB [Eubacterium sp.]|nr:tRNA (guanosine(46)-N7)-methyltransferase TrmB [Eubacterium sp.]
MRLRNVPGAREAIAESRFCINEPDRYKGSWRSDIFHNDHPLHIEIGMGKGDFIIELAQKNPDINYIGIEKFSSVLIRAIEKYEQIGDGLIETELTDLSIDAHEVDHIKIDNKDFRPANLFFIRFDAEHIADIFDKNEVDRIYLNFSDPWPKDRHAKRRLTSPQFLSLYDQILAGDGCIQFKTDNRDLFDYSVEVVESDNDGVAVRDVPGNTVSSPRWHIDEITYDLHHSDQLEGNVMTEYEKKFVALGHPICRFVISRQ